MAAESAGRPTIAIGHERQSRRIESAPAERDEVAECGALDQIEQLLPASDVERGRTVHARNVAVG